MKYCDICGTSLGDEGGECPKCSKSIVGEQIHAGVNKVKPPLITTAQLLTNTSMALSTAGEVTLPIPTQNPGGIINAVAPFQLLIGGIANIFKSYRSALKDKKKLIPVTIMALLWLTMTLLPAMGVNVTSLKWLSWLTFANGGTTGSISAAIGGVLGKGLFAYLLTTISISLGARKNPFKGMLNGLKSIGGSLALKDSASVSLLMGGVGAALIANNFMVGANSMQLSMVSITSFLLMLRSLSSRSSFIRQLVSSITTKKGMPINTSSVTRIMSGLAMGFALSIGLAAIKVAYIGYFGGSL
ncbi:MAG: hypothetical protein Q8N36_06035, partial [bacterium]|nr:hypothetical protein [bacterium]